MVLPIDIPTRKPLEATDLNSELKKIRKEIGIPYYEDEDEDEELFQRHFRLRDQQRRAWHWEKCAKICRLIKEKIEIKNTLAEYEFEKDQGEKKWAETKQYKKNCLKWRKIMWDEKICWFTEELKDDKYRVDRFLDVYLISKVGLMRNHLIDHSREQEKKEMLEEMLKYGSGRERHEAIKKMVQAKRRHMWRRMKMKRRLITAYESAHPDKGRRAYWCPVLKEWVREVKMACLFDQGKECFMAEDIFRPGHADRKTPLTTANWIVVSKTAKDVWEEGLLVIVPDVEDGATESVELWRTQNTKGYKVRVIGCDREVEQRIPGSYKRWKDLDNTKLLFRSEKRPGENYLYYHYCQQILKRSWSFMPGEHNIGKWWSVEGEYMCKNLIQILLLELGEGGGYESLHKGTFGWESGEKEKILQAAEMEILDMDRRKSQTRAKNEAKSNPSIDRDGDWDMLSEISFHNEDPLLKVSTNDETYHDDPNRNIDEKVESETGSGPDSTDSSGNESPDEEKKETPMPLYDRDEGSSRASSSKEESSDSDVDASETYDSDSEKDNEEDIEESDSEESDSEESDNGESDNGESDNGESDNGESDNGESDGD